MSKEELERFVKQGHSIRRIASRMGLSYTAVRYWLRRYGLKTNPVNMNPPKPIAACRNCGKPVRRRPNVYCSLECQWQFIRRVKIESSLNTCGVRMIKSHLLETRGHRCEVCGITEWMGRLAPLELDHKDGNPFNNDLDNLRLICPNCHSQTLTYKNRNMGRGRFNRRRRYATGKSY